MKVAAFIINLSVGGAQGVFVNVVNYLYEHDFDVEVVVQNLDNAVYKEKLNKNINIVNLNVTNAKALFPKLKKYILCNSFSHAFVFGSEITVVLYALRVFLHREFKIISRSLNTLSIEFKYSGGFFRKHITSKLVRVFFHRIDFIIAQSEGMKDDMVQNWGCQIDKVKVINNALQPQYESIMKDSEISDKCNYLLYAGRFEPQKGLRMLLEAFSCIKNKEIFLKLVGTGSMEGELKKMASELSIDNRVEFVGYSTNISDYYMHARATVLTSLYEGFPNVLVESIACGTPVVAFDLPSGPKEIINNGINGYLVPYLDVVKFAEALDQALITDWDAKEIKNSAKPYSREQIMGKYLEVLKNS